MIRHKKITIMQMCPVSCLVSEHEEAAIGYVAGYIVKMTRKKIHCVPCQEPLIATNEKSIALSSFLAKKDRGGFIRANESVKKICCEAQKCLQQIQKTERWFPKHSPCRLSSPQQCYTISHIVLQETVYFDA